MTHDDAEKGVICFDECSDISEDQIKWLIERVSKSKQNPRKPKQKSSRCKGTIDLVEVEYGDAYEKSKKGEVEY